MSEELTTLVQVLELYGRGLGFLGKAIKFTSKGVRSGVDFVKLKNMQRKMKLHYASQGEHNTMKLKDLEKLTGGNYKILNIPIENEKELLGFYDRLKKLKVSFAELPDLCIGDGFTQIAYDPQDAERVKLVVDYYREKLAKEPTEISLEDYEKLGGEEGKKILDELAEKGYQVERCTEQIERIHSRNKSPDYTPISLNFESILLEEYKDRYYFRIPGTMKKDKSAQVICIKKEDALIIDDGQTLFTHLKNGSKLQIFEMSGGGAINYDHPVVEDADQILKHFSKIDVKELWQVNHIKPSETNKLPNFNQGQENFSSALPDAKVEKILHIEEIKERRGKKEYLPIELNVSEALVAEDKDTYVTKLPERVDKKDDHFHCLIIEKSDAYVSEDGKVLSAYLKKGGESKVREIDQTGTTLQTYQMKNETVAAYYLKKSQRTKGKNLGKTLVPVQGEELLPSKRLAKDALNEVATKVIKKR